MARKIRKHALPGDIACCHGPGIKALNCCAAKQGRWMVQLSIQLSSTLNGPTKWPFNHAAANINLGVYTVCQCVMVSCEHQGEKDVRRHAH